MTWTMWLLMTATTVSFWALVVWCLRALFVSRPALPDRDSARALAVGAPPPGDVPLEPAAPTSRSSTARAPGGASPARTPDGGHLR